MEKPMLNDEFSQNWDTLSQSYQIFYNKEVECYYDWRNTGEDFLMGIMGIFNIAKVRLWVYRGFLDKENELVPLEKAKKLDKRR